MLKQVALMGLTSCVFGVVGTAGAFTVIMDDGTTKTPPLPIELVNKHNGALDGGAYAEYWDNGAKNPPEWLKTGTYIYNGAIGRYAANDVEAFNNTGEPVVPGQQYTLTADLGLNGDSSYKIDAYVRATQNADGSGAFSDLAHISAVGTGLTNYTFNTYTNAGSTAAFSLSGYFIQVKVITGTVDNSAGYLFRNINVTADTPQFPGAQWAMGNGGDWNVAGNWGSGIVPNGVGSVALLGGAITSGRTVYADDPITLGSLTFNNANSYNVSGLGTLTMDVASGQGTISVLQGNHKINLPLVFASDTGVTAAVGATLTIADPTTIKANKIVTKSGVVNFTAPLTIEANGQLVNAGGAMTLFAAPTIAAGGGIDAKNSPLNVTYQGIASPAATIKNQLASGYNNGSWDGSGIRTSSAVAGELGLGWVDDTVNQTVRVKLTRYGDADLSGTVTSTDFNAFVADYGNTGTGIWATGDFNYDGKVNTLDFNLLAGNFGLSAPAAPALGSVVPEPASIAGIVLGSLACLRRRRSV